MKQDRLSRFSEDARMMYSIFYDEFIFLDI